MTWSRAVALSCAAAFFSTCSKTPDDSYEAGVPWELAEHRAQTISNLRYEISLNIPDAAGESIRGSEKVTFDLSEADSPVVFDFAQPEENVISVLVNGRAADHEVASEHLVIPAESFHAGENVVDIDFIAGDGSLNRVLPPSSVATPCLNASVSWPACVGERH